MLKFISLATAVCCLSSLATSGYALSQEAYLYMGKAANSLEYEVNITAVKNSNCTAVWAPPKDTYITGWKRMSICRVHYWSGGEEDRHWDTTFTLRKIKDPTTTCTATVKITCGSVSFRPIYQCTASGTDDCGSKGISLSYHVGGKSDRNVTLEVRNPS